MMIQAPLVPFPFLRLTSVVCREDEEPQTDLRLCMLSAYKTQTPLQTPEQKLKT